MNVYRIRRWQSLAALGSLLVLMIGIAPANAWETTVSIAYIGPGPGLGLIGSLLAVLVAILLGFLGLVLYPLRLLRKWRRDRATSTGNDGAAGAGSVSPKSTGPELPTDKQR